MRSTWVLVLCVAVAAGAAGAALFGQVVGTGTRRATPDSSVQVVLDRLDRRLAAIEQRLPPMSSQPELEGTGGSAVHDAREPLPATKEGGGEEEATGTPAKKPADPPATMKEVRAYLAHKMKEAQEEGGERGSRFQVSLGDAGTADLADVAAKLGIDEATTTRIQGLFKNEGEAQLEAVFHTTDIGAIRQRILDAKHDPVAKAKLQKELLTNLMTSLPSLRRAEEAKNAALKDLLGPARYERFRAQTVRESDVDEFDALLEDVLGTTDPEAAVDAPAQADR